MKKLFKWIFILFLTAALLIGGAVTALYFMYPPAKLKEMGQQYFKTHFNREITFDSIGLAVVGITLKGFALSEEGGFKNGTFVSASKAVAKIALKPLLDKELQIKTIGLEDLTVNIIKDKKGKFNFDDLLEKAAKFSSAEDKSAAVPQPDNAPMAFVIVADTIYIKNATVNFSDKAAGMDFAVRKFNFSITQFDINNPFNFEGSFVTDLKLPDIKLSPVNFAYAGRANLAGLVMKDASLELTNFEAAYKSFKAAVSGKVSNFDNPAADLKGTITGIDNRLAQEFAQDKLPEFSLPAINLLLNTITNIDGSTTRINEAKISIGKSFINTTADIDYSKPDLIYKAAVKMAVNLKEVSDIAKESLAAFKLTGDITGDISAASVPAKDLPAVKGHIDFKNIGAVAVEKELKNLSGVITINSLDDIKSNLIKGVFDSSNFSTSFAYAKPAKVMNIDFFFDMDKFTLDDIDFDALIPQNQTKEEKAAAKAAQEAARKNPQQHQPIVDQSAPRGDPMNIKADITIRKIANNIFDTTDLKFKVDIKDLDNRLDKAAGAINFSTKDGEIRDLEKLMNQSKFIRIALTSVRVIQKAFGVLKLESSSFSANSVKYSLIEGAYTLKGGVVNIAKTDLTSDLTTIKTTGTVNLLTEKLDMKVEAHIGKQGTSGFKPVVIKVGGTIAEPSFKLDVASTLTSVLNVPGNTVKGAADVGAGAVKGVVDGVSGAVKGIAGALKK